MIDVQEYETANGTSPFAAWFEDLDSQAAAKINTVVTRLEQENFSNVHGVGGGVFEYVLDWGPGYRVYFGKDGNTLVILLGGGTKKRQDKDIEDAKVCWADYKARKKAELEAKKKTEEEGKDKKGKKKKR